MGNSGKRMTTRTCTGTSPGELDDNIKDAVRAYVNQTDDPQMRLARSKRPIEVHFSTSRDQSFINYSALLVWR